MFILDDSGSMERTHMPDDVEDFGQTSGGTHKYGYVSSQCNGVYYNPNFTYNPPAQVASNGAVTYYPNSRFNSSGGAWKNGFDTSAGQTDLSSAFQAWTTSTVQNTNLQGTDDGTGVAAYYYKYTGSQLTLAQKNYFDTNSDFYKECNSTISGTGPGTAVFTKVTVNSSSGPGGTDERQNFANWYSYYRTRMLMMKSSTGLASSASATLSGWVHELNNNGGQAFLNISDFNGAQKAAGTGCTGPTWRTHHCARHCPAPAASTRTRSRR